MFHKTLARSASCSNSVRVRGLFIALAFIICVSAGQQASAATFTVNTTNDTVDANPADNLCLDAANQCSLRAAISQANNLAGDDIINLPAGTYTQTLVGSENLNVSGDWDILSNITINGSGSSNTILQANASPNVSVERVLHFLNSNSPSTVTASLNNVTVRNGRTNAGTFGAGVRVESSSATTVLNVTFNNVIVRDNVAQGRGSGFYILGVGTTVTANNITVTTNQSALTNTSTSNSSLGGAVYITGGTATFNSSSVSNNTTSQASVPVSPSVPSNAFGGGVTVAGGTINFNGSSITGNTATTSVASASFGAGIAISGGTTNLTDSIVSNNTTSISGTGTSANVGGIDNEGAILNLTRTTVSGNTAGSSGGIRTLGSGSGATAFPATTTLNQSAVVNNIAAGSAGGIFTVSSGTTSAGNATTNINNSTIGGNTANVDGGGILNYTTGLGNAVTNITFSTVAGNTADADANGGNGGGLANFGQVGTSTGTGTISLQSSVVADNMNNGGTSADIVNTITSLGYNHIENTTLGTFVLTTGDATGTDPGLTALALNGGQTLNYLPGAGSVLLETIPSGTSLCGTAPFNFDQKNVIRPSDSDFNGTPACEKGASERGLVILTPSSLPNGQKLAPYSATLTSDYGVAPYTYTLAGGTLPPGLTLNSDGTITGTPTTSGLYTFTVQVQDSNPFARFARNGGRLSAPAAPNVFQKVFQILIVAPTAAGVSIGGRIITPDGMGLRNARIYLTDAQGNTMQAITSSFGYYRFDGIAVGQTVTISVASKRYQFTPQIVNVTEDVGDLNFTAAP